MLELNVAWLLEQLEKSRHIRIEWPTSFFLARAVSSMLSLRWNSQPRTKVVHEKLRLKLVDSCPLIGAPEIASPKLIGMPRGHGSFTTADERGDINDSVMTIESNSSSGAGEKLRAWTLSCSSWKEKAKISQGYA